MKDLRDFIDVLRGRGELVVIDELLDPVLEITEIADRVVKAGGPALLFRNPRGSSFPVLINQFGTEGRTLAALRAESFGDLSARVKDLVTLEAPQGVVDKVRALSRLKDLASYGPKDVRKAPCQEVVQQGEEVDLRALPVLQCWPEDGGRFVTLPVVFTRDPAGGASNAGMYRLQVFDRRTTGMHWHRHKDGAEHYRAAGDKLEVAVAIGTDPAVTYAATAPLPGVINEMALAGFLRGEPVEMVRCRTVDLQVPANSEFVLEGYVETGELRTEGPFGDHTGCYSPADDYPVFHLTALTHRKDPIYSTTIVGKPPMEDCFLAKATERIFFPLLQMTLPEVADMDLPQEGVFHNCAVLSVRKAYPMHAQKVMHAVWGMGQMQFTKFVVVVDADVDVHDYSEVAWRVFNNVDPKRDILMSGGPLDELDHSSPTAAWGAKMGVDATAKWPSEGHGRGWPEDIVMAPEVKAKIDKIWPELGLD